MRPFTSRPYDPASLLKHGRVGRVVPRQQPAVEDLLAVQVRERHFRRRDEVEIPVARNLEEVGLELRQVPGAEERRRVHQERRVHLDVAVLPRVQVEHEIDERPRHARAGAEHDREPRSRHSRGPLEVHDAERHAEVDVRFRLEVEHGGRSPLPHLDVVGRARADGHGLVREIRNHEQGRAQARFDPVEFRLERLDLGAARLVRREEVRGVLAGLLGPRHVLAGGVLLALELLHLRDERPPLGVERREGVEFGVHPLAARGEAFTDNIETIADECGIEHGSDRISKGPTAAIRSRPWRV